MRGGGQGFGGYVVGPSSRHRTGGAVRTVRPRRPRAAGAGVVGVAGVAGGRANSRAALHRRGIAQVFERSRIYWSASTGAHGLVGDVLVRYLALGGPASPLGLPVSGELAVPGGLRAMFTGGQIAWANSHGAKALAGDMHRRYESLTGPWSSLGLPTTEEYDVGQDRQVDFTTGALRWIKQTGAVTLIVAFRATVHPVSASEFPYSYRSGCPVGQCQELVAATRRVTGRHVSVEIERRATIDAPKATEVTAPGAGEALDSPVFDAHDFCNSAACSKPGYAAEHQTNGEEQ